MKNEKLLASLKELQLQMPRIIEAHGNHLELTTLALANPILALKKAGYRFTPEAEEEIEATIRFGKEGSGEYLQAKKEVVGLTKDANIFSSMEKLAEGIEKYLAAAPISTPKTKNRKVSNTDAKNPSTKSKENDLKLNIKKAILERPKIAAGKLMDPLRDYVSFDPIIPLLMKVRSFDESAPALAKEESIPEIMELVKSSPLQSITFELNRNTKK